MNKGGKIPAFIFDPISGNQIHTESTKLFYNQFFSND